MVYQKDFVAVVSVEGKILREERFQGVDVVKIPFGSHYSIRLKNLSNQKCRVKIEIDGKNIAGNRCFLIEPNTEQNIERFLESNMNEGHKFKFIKKTQEISNYRGDRIDDGIIRIEYEFQQPQKVILNEKITWTTKGSSDQGGNWWFGPPTYGINNLNNFDDGHQTYNCNIRSCFLEEGITTKGEYSNQQFQEVNDYAIYEDKRVINIRLMGYDNSGKKIVKPILTNEKITCENCGLKNNSINNFCSRCGTNLK